MGIGTRKKCEIKCQGKMIGKDRCMYMCIKWKKAYIASAVGICSPLLQGRDFCFFLILLLIYSVTKSEFKRWLSIWKICKCKISEWSEMQKTPEIEKQGHSAITRSSTTFTVVVYNMTLDGVEQSYDDIEFHDIEGLHLRF